MCKVFTEILRSGILPALGQHISRTSKLGIFENPNCLRCQQEIPEGLLSDYDFETLIGILPMCATQNSFQTFCTRVIESTLLEMVRTLSMEYVFAFDFSEMINHIPPVTAICSILAGKSCHRLISGTTNGPIP